MTACMVSTACRSFSPRAGSSSATPRADEAKEDAGDHHGDDGGGSGAGEV